jgi:uncharacterized protein YbdZ (MbtH family)
MEQSLTWDVIQNAQGEYQLIETGAPVPEGWTVVAVTANPEYLEYLVSLE